jgi:hypothetical protein
VAFSIIGWYLMTPPVLPDTLGDITAHRLRAHIEMPLSQWVITQVFDTAAECEETKSPVVTNAGRLLRAGGITANGEQMQASFAQAQCVAGDDPRLAR